MHDCAAMRRRPTAGCAGRWPRCRHHGRELDRVGVVGLDDGKLRALSAECLVRRHAAVLQRARKLLFEAQEPSCRRSESETSHRDATASPGRWRRHWMKLHRKKTKSRPRGGSWGSLQLCTRPHDKRPAKRCPPLFRSLIKWECPARPPSHLFVSRSPDETPPPSPAPPARAQGQPHVA